MKNLISALALLATTAFAAHVSADQTQTKEVTVTVSEVYVPGGFSQDTDAYVIVSGMFPNSCYKWDKATVVNKTDFVHEVTSQAKVSQSLCLMVMVPYQKEVDLGKLAKGDHTLRFLNGDGTFFEKTLTVE